MEKTALPDYSAEYFTLVYFSSLVGYRQVMKSIYTCPNRSDTRVRTTLITIGTNLEHEVHQQGHDECRVQTGKTRGAKCRGDVPAPVPGGC